MAQSQPALQPLARIELVAEVGELEEVEVVQDGLSIVVSPRS